MSESNPSNKALSPTSATRYSPTSPSSDNSATIEAVERATKIATKLLSTWPDYDKATKPYVLGVTEFIATLNDVEIADLLHLRTGIRAKSKFLPTVADMATLLAKAEKDRAVAAEEYERIEYETQQRARAELEEMAAEEHRKYRREHLREHKLARLEEAKKIWPDAWIDWNAQDGSGNWGCARSSTWEWQQNNGWTFRDNKLWPR